MFIYLFIYFNSPFGKSASCEAPRVMPHCTSGWSLRWFHHRLVTGRHRWNTLYSFIQLRRLRHGPLKLISSLPNTDIQPTPPGFEPWTLALRAAALNRLRQSDRTLPVVVTCNGTNYYILKTLCDKYQKWIFEVGRGQKLTKCTQNWCLNMFWHLSQHKGGGTWKRKKLIFNIGLRNALMYMYVRSDWRSR